MGRPVYPHELADSDFSWLINSYRENNPQAVLIESSCLPLILIKDDSVRAFVDKAPERPKPPIVDEADTELVDQTDKE